MFPNQETDSTRFMYSDLRIDPDSGPVRDQVVSVLKRALFSGRFVPGQRLTERSLCEWTGASRPAVREGLRQLEAEGLIEITPNRGPSVVKLGPKECSEIFTVRAELESLLCRLAVPRVQPHHIVRLRQAASAYRNGVELERLQMIVSAKEAMYDVLFELADNRELRATLQGMIKRLGLIWSQIMFDRHQSAISADEIERITNCISIGDTDTAEQAMRAHLTAAAERVAAWHAGDKRARI